MIKAIEQGPARSRPGPPTRERVLSAEAASLMTALLQDVVERGTGSRTRLAGLPGQMAGKTGTTNEGRDAWFVGYSSRLLALVWVGFDSGAPHGLTAAEAAVPIWADGPRPDNPAVAPGAGGPGDRVVRCPSLTEPRLDTQTGDTSDRDQF